MTERKPAPGDFVDLPGGRCRIEYVGSGPYSVEICNAIGDRMDWDLTEFELVTPSTGYGVPTTWRAER